MKDNKLILKQILQFTDKIESYLDNISHDEFLLDAKTQDAVIRNIEIIGEACNRLDQDFIRSNPEFPILEATSMRNRLIHGYDDVDIEIVWVTATKDVQTLKAIILQLI